MFHGSVRNTCDGTGRIRIPALEEIQQDNTNGAEEFLADFSMEDSEFTAEDETESFQSGEEFQDHEDFQNGEESISEEIRYTKDVL